MNHERGYALWVTVLVVALLALATLTLAQTHDATRPRVAAAQAQARAAIAVETISARVAFLMLTEPIGPRSVVLGAPREAGMASAGGGPELRLDGRLYSIGELVWVGVQDEAGLISVNATDEDAIAGLLTNAGLGADRARRLAAALADFVDADDLVRAGGAEGNAYGDAQIAPLNGPLSTRWTLLDVLGWRAALENQRIGQRLFNSIAVGDGEGGVNLNTAPRPVLYALLGARLGADVAERREQGEIRDVNELQLLTNSRAAAGAGFATMPGGAFRVTVLLGHDDGGALFVERRLLLLTDGERPALWQEERRGAGDAGYREAHEQPIEPYPDARARSAR